MKKRVIFLVFLIFLLATIVNANPVKKDYDINIIKNNADIICLKGDDSKINFYALDTNNDKKIDTVYIERISKNKTEVIRYTDIDHNGWLDELSFDRDNNADGIFETTTDLPYKSLKISNILPEK